MPSIMPIGKQQYTNNAGVPLAGGRVHTFAVGTTEPKATYQDAAGTVENTNPIVLNARGEALAFWDGAYSVKVTDANGLLIYTVDNYQAPLMAADLSADDGAEKVAGTWFNGIKAKLSDLGAKIGASLIGFIQGGAGAVQQSVQEALRERVSVTQFGADMKGEKDSASALQAAVDHVYSLGGGTVHLPAGVLKVGTKINCYPLASRRIVIQGSGQDATIITTAADIAVFEHAEFFECADLKMRQTGAPKTGRAFSTPVHKQAAHCRYQRLTLEGFKYGAWWRYSLWNTVKDVTGVNCGVVVKGSRNAQPDNQSNPPAPGGWNLDPGFFHNCNRFENVLCDGGEVGVWGTFHSSYFDITSQNQSATGADNVVAPIGTPGVGLWLQNDGNGTSTFGAVGNVIEKLYTEFTQQPLVIEHAEASLSALYSQGSSNAATPFEQVVRIVGVNAELNARGVVATGSDYFKYGVVADGATIYGDVTVAAWTIADKLLDSGAKYYDSRASATNLNVVIKAADGPKTIHSGLVPNRVYTVTIGGVYDGFLAKAAVFTVFYFDPVINKVVMQTGGDADIELTVGGASLRVAVSNAGTYNLFGTVMDWRAEGNAL